MAKSSTDEQLDVLLKEYADLRRATNAHHHKAWCDYKDCGRCQRRDEIAEEIQDSIDLATAALNRLVQLSGV